MDAPADPAALHAAMLQPIPAHSVLRDPDWHLWGGGITRTADGTCHLLCARWPKARGFNAWVSHSEIAWATAADPLGPYTIRGTALAPAGGTAWDASSLYNPLVITHAGKYYLYYTGNAGDGTWWNHRNRQRIGLAIADHPGGPWRRSDRPLLEPTPGSWDGLVANCPVVTRGNDGRFYMVYKGVAEGPLPKGGPVRMGMAIAEQPEGPFVKQPGTFFDAPGAHFPTDDNTIWASPTGFHAIVKDYGGHFQKTAKEALVLFDSPDARTWTPRAPDALLTTFRLRFADGGERGPFHRVDQPQVWLDDGRPAVLCLTIKERSDKDDSDLGYLVQVPLR